MRRAIVLAGAIVVMSMGAAGRAQTDQPSATVELLPDHLVRRIERDTYSQSTAELVGRGLVSQGIVSGAKRWDPAQAVTVCFFGGSRSLRQHIAGVASLWEAAGSAIRFDFGEPTNPRICSSAHSAIRVGFSQPGYWSLVGQDSVTYASQDEQSLNLAGFDRAPPDEPEFTRVVLHEFGHALGFQHEHQNPLSTCENEFDWPAIYKYLGGPLNYWSKETVDHNMRSRAYLQGDLATSFDRESIMLYTFPAQFYRKGSASPCFSGTNYKLSNGDKTLLISAYGPGGTTRNQFATALTTAAAQLSLADQDEVKGRLAYLAAPNELKPGVVGTVRPEFVDVDVFACKLDQPGKALATDVVQALSQLPNIGRLRYRDVAYPGTLPAGVNIIADIGHPEESEARRIESSLARTFGDRVQIKPNSGRQSRWLVSIAACS